MTTNPLLAPWTTPFELPPFDAISDDDFQPAFEAALTEARAELAAIADNPEPATFANTIDALALMGEAMDKALAPFFLLSGVDSNPKREELMRAFSPKLAAWGSEVMMNRETLGLSEEQQRVLFLERRGFQRAGAGLKGADYERLKEIKNRLAVIGTEFTQNLLADERDWFMEIGADDLGGALRAMSSPCPAPSLCRSCNIPTAATCARKPMRPGPRAARVGGRPTTAPSRLRR